MYGDAQTSPLWGRAVRTYRGPPSWQPERVTQIGNSFRNQFEVPPSTPLAHLGRTLGGLRRQTRQRAAL